MVYVFAIEHTVEPPFQTTQQSVSHWPNVIGGMFIEVYRMLFDNQMSSRKRLHFTSGLLDDVDLLAGFTVFAVEQKKCVCKLIA